MLLHLALLGCAQPPAATLSGVAGGRGAILRADGADDEPRILQRHTDDGWVDVSESSVDVAWADTEGRAGDLYRLYWSELETGGVELQPNPVTLAFADAAGQLLFLDGEVASLAAAVDGDVGDLRGALTLRRGDGASLLAGCEALAGDDCWSEGEARFLSGGLGDMAAVALPPLTVDVGAPGAEAFALTLQVSDPDLGEVALAEAEVSLLYTGYWLAWGDLHAHTNLSMDGCEDPDADCDDRGEAPADDFYGNARANGLDFAAMTDHAEFVTYVPYPGHPGIAIWEEANLLAAAADDADFVPLLGYEWTKPGGPDAEDPERVGGHKTVVLRALSVCPEYRVSSHPAEINTKIHGEGVYFGPNLVEAGSAGDLYAAFDAARAVCGDAGPLSFFHHATNMNPQAADWTMPGNAPDADYEPLVEIYSEHGASECLVPEGTCGFGVSAETDYWANGSVQAALSAGHRLGFAGGTDSHDSRPGSLDDGPSAGDFWVGEELIYQQTPGGLTGAMMAAPLGRDALFEALTSRRTLVTSGPRPAVRASAVGAHGGGYPPGAEIPASASPLQVIVEIGGDEVRFVQLVSGEGEVLVAVPDTARVADLDLAAGEAVYTRVVLESGGEEQRIWISPWFGVE
jgi:hypothetical protein